MGVRPARADDVERMLDLAERKRQAYAQNASPFQRPAADARSAQRSFFHGLLGRRDFVLRVHERDGEVDGFLIGRIGPLPPPFGRPGFHVDDFALAAAARWDAAGAALLRDAVAASGGEEVVVVCGHVDAQKGAFLRASGLAARADWWVKPLTPGSAGEVEPPAGVHAVITTAPAVYDPGGPVALAPALESPALLEALERWAAARGAVIVVVPAWRDDDALVAALRGRGYAAASEWYEGSLTGS